MSLRRIAAVVSGAAAFGIGVMNVSGPTVPDDHWGVRGAVLNGLGIVAFLTMAVAAGLLPGLLRLRRTGVVGVRIAQAGLTLMTAESVASEVHDGNTLGPVFMLGLLLALVGFLVLGVDALRSPGARWLAMLPLVSLLVGIGAGDRGGFVISGVAWCGLGLGHSVRDDASGDVAPALDRVA